MLENQENIEESSSSTNWTTYCSRNLKNPVSKKLVVNKPSKNCSEYSDKIEYFHKFLKYLIYNKHIL